METVEIWKPISDVWGYEVSTYGRVRNSQTGKVLSPEWRDNRKGRKDARVTLRGHHYAIARLVAQTFLKPPQIGMTVNHVDGDLRNNSASNLEWLSRKDNVAQARNAGSFCRVEGIVRLIECGKDAVHEFENVKEAADFLSCSHGAMRRACYNGGAVRDLNGQIYTVEAKCELRAFIPDQDKYMENQIRMF